MAARVYLTGATGFVGQGLLARLSQDGVACTVAVRRPVANVPVGVRVLSIASFEASAELAAGLAGHDVVVHCAGRAHVMHEQAADSLAAFRAVNVDGTLNLARQAAAAGVKRFVFLSSVKVNGEESQSGLPYRADSAAAPADAYGISKHEAEQALRVLAGETGMEVVIIRPVLVYGPGVKANFHSMMSWVAKGVPLPLGAIHNRRSLVALENLVDLIVTCIDHPAAANQTFLVSDDEDVSTSELLRKMARALGKPARLLPLPASWLRAAATLLGKSGVAKRLCGSLQVDISHTKTLLGWAPPVTLDAALQRTAADFLER
jgi:nucleoside-diphosphate-sugar epimerase